MKLEQGAIVAGRFRLVRPLGRGGMGEVWVAHDERLATPCAVKFLHAGIDPSARRRFELEAKSAAQLRSPNVVQILDHGETDGVPYIAMELLDGEDLATRITRQGPLSPEQTVKVVEQVARALSRAHALGIVHRDLKPANVFLARDDDREVVKVLDFGIAKLYSDEVPPSRRAAANPHADASLTATGLAMGTPRYMSPEQIEGGDIDARTDVWALGLIAFECLTGTSPFETNNLGVLYSLVTSGPTPVLTALRADLPPAVDGWLAKALAKDRGRRYPTARDLADALARALALHGATQAPVESGGNPSRSRGADSAAATVAAPTGAGSGEMFDPTVAQPFTPAPGPKKARRSRAWLAIFAVVPVGLGVGYALRRAPADAEEERSPSSSVAAAVPSGAPGLESSALQPRVAPKDDVLERFVPGSSPAVEVAAGLGHTCARLASGAVTCWGRGVEGQLGAVVMPSSSAVLMPDVSGATRVVAGGLSTCVLDGRGQALCRGLVESSLERVPGVVQDVVSLALSPSRGLCSVKTSGRVMCSYEIAGKTEADRTLVGVSDAQQVALGWEHGCVLHTSGKVSCWGSNSSAQLAGPAGAKQETPREVPGASDIVQLTAGRSFTCARRKDGAILCWGNPDHGVLGVKDRRRVKHRIDVLTIVESPKETRAEVVLGVENALDVAAGDDTACAVLAGGELVCWGNNQFGSLGRGTSGVVTLETGGTPARPERVLEGVRQVDVGAMHACAVLVSGEVRCWGRGDEQQLGFPTPEVCEGVGCATKPTPVF